MINGGACATNERLGKKNLEAKQNPSGDIQGK